MEDTNERNMDTEVDSHGNSFVLISNNLEKHLIFNPKNSFILSFGIDKQLDPLYEHKSLGLTVKMDVLEVTKALVEHLHIDSFETLCSSDETMPCTRFGMEQIIEDSAKKVGQDGILFLFFGGHGVNDQNKKWALAPADFDLSPNMYITSEVINKCIKSSDCKAKYILVILDCCYSGIMGNDMTANTELLLPNLFVLAAGSAYESSIAITSLHHSIFSYFLKMALEVVPKKFGTFPLVEVHNICKDCTTALSSLILTVDNCSIKSKHIVPSLFHFNPETIHQGVEDVDGDVFSQYSGRMGFVFDLLIGQTGSVKKPRPKLHFTTYNWLQSLSCGNYQPIYLIASKNIFETQNTLDKELLLKTIVALIMQSIGVLELFHNLETVGDPEIFLTGFVHTIAAVDFVFSNFNVTPEYLLLSWALYHQLLMKNNINDDKMKELFEKIKLLLEKTSGEQSNSIEVKEWSPL